MPRRKRMGSESGLYHVTARGVNKEVIFPNDPLRLLFLRILDDLTDKREVGVHAWCLMGNHFHLLVRTSSVEVLSAFMMELMGQYSKAHNRSFARVGPLFQDRYWSDAIETDERLLATVRYIHQNPEKAGIAPTADYRWSSYRSYVVGRGKVERSLVLGLLGSVEAFVSFHKATADADKRLLESEGHDGAALVESADWPVAALGRLDVSEVKGLRRRDKAEAVERLREAGFSVSEIHRLTGVSRSTIRRYLSAS